MSKLKNAIRFTAILGVAATCVQAAPRPNIILVMADDMGWGDPGYYSSEVTYADGSPHVDQGWISTPTMDAMAENGLRFDRFYSASSVCSPTRASCLTGRNPVRVGIGNANSGRLGFDETPLSEVLSNAGYRCGHFGKWHVGTMTTLRTDGNRGRSGNEADYSAPWHHQYDFCFATESKVPTYNPYSGNSPLPSDFDDPNFYGTRYWRIPSTWNYQNGEGDAVPVEEVNNPVDGDDSKLLVDQAIPFMQDAVASSEPFFLVMWFHTPHKPIIDPDGVSGIDSSDAARDSIEDMDTALGRIRDELTNLGVRDNTMFWVTSDNGPENGVDSFNETEVERSIRAGRHRGRKGQFYEGGIIVPGILEWPDAIASGRITDIPAVTSDYYPTILDYLELSVPGQKPLDGISLRPVIENTIVERAKPIGFKKGGDRAWIDNEYKLVRAAGIWELFDLVNFSPGEESEQTPLADENNVLTKPQAIQDVYNAMLAEYNAWETTVNQDTPNVHYTQPNVTLNADPETYGAFTVTAQFSEDVFQLNAGEFVITNGVASDLTGSGTSWSVTVTPSVYGPVTVALPEGCAIDVDGNINADSGLLSVTYLAPPANYPPSFNTDPVVEVNATEGVAYTATLADDASDAESDPLNFSRISGPSWLAVASDGSLSGIPDLVDIGLNNWFVQVSDGNGNDMATLEITVDTASGSWSELMFDDFEAGFGNWIDGGANSQWYSGGTYAHQGNAAINLQAIGEESVMTTADLALSGMSRILVSSWVYTRNFNAGEDLWLQVSTDGGANYTTVRTWTLDIELFNDQFVSLSHEISGVALTDQTRLRFRCDGSGTRDDVYLDEVQVLIDSAPPTQNYPPAFVGNPVVEVSATENEAYSSSIADNASDPEGDPMSFSLVGPVTWLSVAPDGTLSGTPGSGDVGLNSFTIQVDATGGSDTATLEITVDEVITVTDLYISDISMSSTAHNGNRYSGVASVTVKDESGATVSGASVSVDWSGVTSSSASADTDGSGLVVFESGRKKNGGTYTVTVTDVTASGYNYNPALNVESSDSVTAP